MKSLIIIITILYSFVLSQEKILFIGNSFTFYWNLPSIVQAMTDSSGLNIEIYQSTAGGASLKQHWMGDKNLKTRTLINNNKYDVIVLQDYSTNPLLNTVESLDYFSRFIELANNKNIKSILYGTWMFPAIPYKNSYGKDPIIDNLKPISTKYNIPIAPVGTAFRLFQKSFPEISLYTSDNKHPSPVGSYLAACIFYRVITGKKTKGLPRRFTTKDKDGKKIYINIVEKDAALKCQSIADQINLRQY